MSIFDHLYSLLIMIGIPVYSAWSWRRWLAGLAAGHRLSRMRLYVGSLAQLWLLFVLLFAFWWLLARPPGALGFTVPSGARLWWGLLLVAAATLGLLRYWSLVRRASAEDRRRYRRQIAELGHMMPRNAREYGVFALLSLTAGIVEETLFRGYLLWYLDAFMPLWTAVLFSSFVFGLAHSYQGLIGIAKTGALGLALALLYLLSGSLWLAILAHAMVDLLQGATMLELYRDEQPHSAAANIGS